MFSDIKSKINIAQKKLIKLEKFGKKDEIESLIDSLRKIILDTENERAKIGMTEICSKCGEQSIPCCGSGIENKYSPELLLINIMMGANLLNDNTQSDRCYFLGMKGCILLARDVFCINYICEKIRDRLQPIKLKELREMEGKQLILQFQLEEKLKRL